MLDASLAPAEAAAGVFSELLLPALGSSFVTTGFIAVCRSECVGLLLSVGLVALRTPPNLLCTALIAFTM